jgi:hypothetical protein
MKRYFFLLLVLTGFLIGGRGTCQAQRTVYATNCEHYAVWWFGSGRGMVVVSRETFWTDINGHVVQCSDSSRGILPSDKPHVSTRLYLGQASVRVPLPPWVLGVVVAGGVLLLAFVAVGVYARGRESRHG